MTAEVHHDQMKYAIGQSVPRTEDPKLLKGEGKYTDDLNLPDQVYAAIVRSPVAHGIIKDINVSDAKEMPGVLLIVTGYDLENYGNLPCDMQIKSKDGSPLKKPSRPSLVTDKVRFVGDPVACVIAQTPDAAKDAAELVSIDIDILPATTLATEAAMPGAPVLYDDVAGNIALDFQFGEPDTVDKAFKAAHHISRVDIRNNRIVVAPMEPRSAIAHYNNETDSFTMRLGCQGTFGMRNQLAGILNMEREKVRVLTENVGGSFGMKSFVYPEYICLLHAAKKLSRPVKWTEERSSSFLSDQQGRDHEVKGELALNKEGDFLAVRLFLHSNLGGYLAAVGPNMATNNMVKNITSVYKTPLIEINTKCVFTNTTPISAYRGAGRPEANYYMERLIETAAKEMGIDRMELRMRNHIRPDQIPYKAPSGQNYDSGNFSAILKNGLKFSDWETYETRREISRKKGLLRGIGVSNYLEVTAPVETEMGGIRFEENGDITIITGTLDYGQGHAAPFAQVLHSQLGVPFEKIRLLQGDSDELITGGGTGGSKSIMASGGAIVEASVEVIKKAKQAASHVFEAPIQDIELHNGNMLVAGTDRTITLSELSHKLKTELIGVPDLPNTLDVKLDHGGVPSAFPNGCHVCEVEIDPETGQTIFDDYYMVNDFGVLINPLMVEGQCHGGVAQGLGQAVMEDVVYDADGQVLSGSFMDYALPRASDLPNFHFASLPSPATTNALGVKGCGEAGCAGAMPAIMNAIVDALSEFGISHIDMPATPQKIWRAIQEVKRQ
ncbi:xanthine dehydrogenase family protein molybdopterin-binding subunit [Alphaproteobacteria bacterium]|nr:xanthine dehydrogenase family protein molybdopterin-binding subunit [Alphaproteobacteria bacterium]